jgi:hypothetical protein
LLPLRHIAVVDTDDAIVARSGPHFSHGEIMKVLKGLLALAVLMPIGAASADDFSTWPKSDKAKCLMERGDTTVAARAAQDANCGPVGDSSRAGRAFVLADAYEDVIRGISSGDAKGAKDLMNVLWQVQNRSPQLQSCWKTMIKVCDAAEMGTAIDNAAKK